jgi:small-conductance mechanosensitive channel
VLAENLAAQRRAHEKLSDEIDAYTQRLQYLAQLRVAWSRRFEIASAERSTADQQAWSRWKDWQKETKAALEDLAGDLRMQILRMRDLRSTLTSLTKKADDAKNGPEGLLAALELQQIQVEAMLKVRERAMVTIETSRRVHEKLLEEIGSGVLALSPKTLALGAWYQVDRVWNYQITSINDKPITVRKIVTGLSIFVVGWMAARFLSALFAYRLLKRFRLSKDGIAAIRTLMFYTLLGIVVLVALRTVNVPLTAFTILGGALAIGVGFGSQALINNFIGGLIMLAERPVRLGERITFANFAGVVEDVGFRCTRLRTDNDHLVTIPNSTLVNESIENTARRRTIRRLMNVTITYDTPREKVAAAVQAIRDILEEKDIRERIHPIVGFEELPPRVFFNDYNAESLNIQVVYWYAPTDNWAFMEHSERVNYRIMEEFARLGVEFAFPSRTVYVKHQGGSAAPFERSGNGHANHTASQYA